MDAKRRLMREMVQVMKLAIDARAASRRALLALAQGQPGMNAHGAQAAWVSRA